VKVDGVVGTLARRAPDPRLGAEHLVQVADFVAEGSQRSPCELLLGASDAHARRYFRKESEARGPVQVASAVVAHPEPGAHTGEASDHPNEAVTEKISAHGC
jgi:hypothetical protein